MDWNPGQKYELYIDRIQGVLADGESRTVRGVYYALEARGFGDELAEYGFDFAYKYVKKAVRDGRRAGYIDPGQIFDASRSAEATQQKGYPSGPEVYLRQRVETIHESYDRNAWLEQDTYVEVWLEKQALASVFEPICDDWNVRLEATRGDWSDSKVYEATKRLTEKLDAGNQVRVLYWGDFNPSGLHAPVTTQERMGHYGIEIPRDYDDNTEFFDIWPFHGPLNWLGHDDADLMFERCGINLAHVKRYDLPENPTPSKTIKDRVLRDRFKREVAGGRDVNIELDALKEYHRDDLEDEIEDGITQHIDMDTWDGTKDATEAERDDIEDAISIDYSDVPDGTRSGSEDE